MIDELKLLCSTAKFSLACRMAKSFCTYISPPYKQFPFLIFSRNRTSNLWPLPKYGQLLSNFEHQYLRMARLRPVSLLGFWFVSIRPPLGQTKQYGHHINKRTFSICDASEFDTLACIGINSII